MVIEVCQSKSTASTLENFKLVFQVLPKFASAQLAQEHWGFFLGPLACLPCWLEAQLLIQVHNCSQINHGPGNQWTAARQHHSLAWQTWSHSQHQQLGRQSVPAWTPLARSVSQPTWAFKVHLLLSQHGHPVNSSWSCLDQWRHGGAAGSAQEHPNSFFLEKSTKFLELEKCVSGFPILPKILLDCSMSSPIRRCILRNGT